MFIIFERLSLFVLLWVLVIMIKSKAAASAPKLVGKFTFANAAFTSIYPNGEGDKRTYDLLLSSFSTNILLPHTEVSIVRDVKKYLNDVPAIKPEMLTDQMKWPNEISGVPPEVFKTTTTRYAVIPDGFLVPTKRDGSITLVDLEFSNCAWCDIASTITHRKYYRRQVISKDSDSWFYHRVIWRDMDKDGRLDALTCGAQVVGTNGFKGSLVWFRQPENDQTTNVWQPNTIASGPDVNLAMVNMKNDAIGAKEVIITTEYFNPRIRIFWTEDPEQNWVNSEQIKNRDIDNVSSDPGDPFDVIFEDINNDGKPDIVVTMNSHTDGSVVAYETPNDFRTGTFTKHVLTSGYKTMKSSDRTAGPGPLKMIASKDPKTKPSILVAGDDAAVASILTPSSPTDSSDWTYTRNDFFKTQNSTVGGISFGDVDGDGNVEFFIPSYDEGNVYVYRMAED